MTTTDYIPSRWRQHFTLDLPEAGKPHCILIHACSVGEVASIVPLIEALLAEGHAIHLTVVTRTGMQHACRVFGDRIGISYLAWDLPWVMQRFLNRIQPDLFLLTETEFWPRMLRLCKQRGIPIIGINTRISDRSFPRYYASRWLWKRWLSPVQMFLAQSQQDADRLHQIGIESESIVTCGNLKYALETPQVDAMTLRQKVDSSASRPILLIASTHEDEETQILKMWTEWRRICPDLLCLIVPRHPQRFDAVADIICAQGVSFSRWSKIPSHHQHDIILVDSMGILTQLYTIADIAFIGGSLVPVGGHNPLEAAICGRGVVTGPHVQNFREMMSAMQKNNAAIVAADSDELEKTIARLLNKPDELQQLHANAALFMQDKTDVVGQVMKAIKPWLPKIESSR
ncbi:MAG: 3-deoxy-D-manno-octulosonic acid transferase [Mariprofundaceae bacterium]